MIVVLDNRDSFVFNLARYFVLLGQQVSVLPSHEADLEEIRQRSRKHLSFHLVHAHQKQVFQ